MNNNKVSLVSLFTSFASIGAITFGGGYAMLPFLEREVCDKRAWIKNEELLDFYALGQCTPGIIAINVATYIGYKKRGFLGALFSSIGIIFPSIFIITIISALFINFQDNQYVISAVAGIKVVVCALIANSIYRLVKKSIIDKTTFSLFIIALICLFIFKINIYLLILLSIIAGLVIKKVKKELSHAK
ncbi:MAG: chromate transporter [Sphaerochaetaceae bacterium]|nr:chromate transporter [Sphaerochaetaceae bacterium]MDC7237072.1 chromate transporter [Sphaerochaetaceae bacterium]MDC7243363.1 chromate transporter [Sphaerochaetaceae bacterium]